MQIHFVGFHVTGMVVCLQDLPKEYALKEVKIKYMRDQIRLCSCVSSPFSS